MKGQRVEGYVVLNGKVVTVWCRDVRCLKVVSPRKVGRSGSRLADVEFYLKHHPSDADDLIIKEEIVVYEQH